MKLASVKELYELIATNCKHYVAIIENYKAENLQTMFNMNVRRIDGHLLIKYKLNAIDRAIEVGFFDDSNTDEETLSELKHSIKFVLKTYDEQNTDRRRHIVAQFDDNVDASQPSESKPVKKALPDNYFDPKSNPELTVSAKQLKSAGYASVPSHLKKKETQLKTPVNEVFDISKFEESLTDDYPAPPVEKLDFNWDAYRGLNQPADQPSDSPRPRVPANMFDPKSNPELKVSAQQLQRFRIRTGSETSQKIRETIENTT